MNKINLIEEILRELDVNTWMIYSEDNSDPIMSKYICDKTLVAACAIVTLTQKFLIVHDLEKDNININEFTVVPFGVDKTFSEALAYVFNELKFPLKIHLNYSTRNDVKIDKIGYGTYVYLTKIIEDNYNKLANLLPSFHSAEEVIYALMDRKSNITVDRMKRAADITIEILEDAFSALKVGMSELEIVELTHGIFEEYKAKEVNNLITNIEYSWKSNLCPIVLVGPSLKKGGHAMASEQCLEEGHTVYFDFGVKLTYLDGEKVSSDIQRMGYVLKDGEKQAPNEIIRVFDTLINSISAGIEYIKPGVMGYEVDEVVRNFIIAEGYPSYNHATGHSIGEEAHNSGTNLGQKGGRMSNQIVQKSGVYTIEPRIAINNGGSIEEMIYVTEEGGIPISRRQQSLYLISNK